MHKSMHLASLFVDGGKEEVVRRVDAGGPHDVVLPARVHSVKVRHVQDLIGCRAEDKRDLSHAQGKRVAIQCARLGHFVAYMPLSAFRLPGHLLCLN